MTHFRSIKKIFAQIQVRGQHPNVLLINVISHILVQHFFGHVSSQPELIPPIVVNVAIEISRSVEVSLVWLQFYPARRRN